MLDLGNTNTTSFNKPHAQLSNLIQSNDAGSGASTPPLWRPETPRKENYSTMSPMSRTEAIAKGQKELMDMVKNMPESCYELSLKDLVEANRVSHHQAGTLRDDGKGQHGNYPRRASPRAHRQHGHGQMVRSGSLDGSSGGFLLKMVFPVVPWGARKKKKKMTGGLDASNGNNGVININRTSEKDWWKTTRSSISTESARGESVESNTGSSSLDSGSRKSSIGSSSSSSSNNSGINSRSNSSGRRDDVGSDCWSFIRKDRQKQVT